MGILINPYVFDAGGGPPGPGGDTDFTFVGVGTMPDSDDADFTFA
jgi:hypothetical protein